MRCLIRVLGMEPRPSARASVLLNTPAMSPSPGLFSSDSQDHSKEMLEMKQQEWKASHIQGVWLLEICSPLSELWDIHHWSSVRNMQTPNFWSQLRVEQAGDSAGSLSFKNPLIVFEKTCAFQSYILAYFLSL